MKFGAKSKKQKSIADHSLSSYLTFDLSKMLIKWNPRGA